MPDNNEIKNDHQKYVPGVQEKSTLGGAYNTGVTSSDPEEKELIEKQGNFAKLKPRDENIPHQ